jgi:aerobic-type carbon monoxide dehydrogenase small subunit (CoxS/CutS family)
MSAATTQLTINGSEKSVTAEPNDRLLWVLRDQLGLTGAKYGCGEGACGACTVLVDGKPARSCITLIGQCAGKEIATIESLERDGQLHPVQQAFLKVEALQCGYCTPGMVMGSVALLEENKSPSREEIVKALDGNICRCCTYVRIMQAVEQAAAAMKGVA